MMRDLFRGPIDDRFDRGAEPDPGARSRVENPDSIAVGVNQSAHKTGDLRRCQKSPWSLRWSTVTRAA